MQSYEPGMPLFQFFFAKCVGCFNEPNLFLSYALVGVATLLPITRKLTWKKWSKIPIFAFFIFIFPLALGNSNLDMLTYYNTLFIDPMLALYFGYTLYLSLTNTIDRRYKYILFMLGICTLVLLKDTGILFAIFSSIAFIINEFIIDRNKGKKITLKQVICFLLPIISIIIIFGSWKVTQKLYGSPNMYTDEMRKDEIIEFFSSPSESQKKIYEDYIYEVKNSSIIVSNSNVITPYLTYKNLIIFLIIGFSILIVLKQEKRKIIITLLVYFLGSAVFTIGTLGVYMFSLHFIGSFPRYMSTIIETGFLLMFFLIIDDWLDDKIISEKYKCYITIVTIIAIMILPIKFPEMTSESWLKKYDDLGMIYSEKIKRYLPNGETEKIILVFSDNHYANSSWVIMHHQIYMDLLDEGFGYLQEKAISGNMTDEQKREYMDSLKGFDYVYFIVIDKKDKEVFNSFLDEPIEDSKLFRINNFDDIISLEKKE